MHSTFYIPLDLLLPLHPLKSDIESPSGDYNCRIGLAVVQA